MSKPDFPEEHGRLYFLNESGDLSASEYQREASAVTRQHVAAIEESPDNPDWVFAGMPVLVLRTIGRRSGREHKVALPYWDDPEGRRIIVGSWSGLPQHPSWYLNLADRNVNPEVLVTEHARRVWAEARILEGADRQATWAALVVERPLYTLHQSRTDRQLPLVHLAEVRPA